MLKVALIGVGEIAKYQMEALSLVSGIVLTDAHEGADILLHHSLESVFKIEDKKMILLKNRQGDKARLTNHYISLFSELKKDYRNGNARLEHAVALHHILFNAMDKSDNFQGFD